MMAAMEMEETKGLEKEPKKRKTEEETIRNPNPNHTNLLIEPARVFAPLCFFWVEYGPLPTEPDFDGLLFSMSKKGFPRGLKVSNIYSVLMDGEDFNNFKSLREDNFLGIRLDKNFVEEEDHEDEEMEETALELRCRNLGVNYWELAPQQGYNLFTVITGQLFTFAVHHPPPGTIVFVSPDGDFAPFLAMLKRKGYVIIAVPRSEDASAAFLKAGLVPYDWGLASRGQGFFPIGF